MNRKDYTNKLYMKLDFKFAIEHSAKSVQKQTSFFFMGVDPLTASEHNALCSYYTSDIILKSKVQNKKTKSSR